MRILLDENVAWAILDLLTSLGHQVDHVKSIGGGLKNGAEYRKAKESYELLISNDRDFLNPKDFPPTKNLGIIFLQIKMMYVQKQIEALKKLLEEESPERLKGNLILLRESGPEKFHGA